MSEQPEGSPGVPVWDELGIPENDEAEPADAGDGEHVASGQ